MTILPYLFVLSCLLTISVQRSMPSDDSYVAAVLEYQVLGTTAANLANYLSFIKEAADRGADIVVFPELTLNRMDPIEVPIHGILQTYPVPAVRPDLYHNALVSISQAALDNQIYVVINVEEAKDCTEVSDLCPEVKRYLFNTNVVFDRSGAVIDRYRKINLFGEFTRTPALKPDLGVFDTDFGVTFGHYVCFDLLFQVPALQVVEKLNITDIVFTTMWFSELPYLNAVQIQEAYAYEMNVNFLGAGTNNVRVGSAGSGIYSGRAGALVSTMPGLPTSRLLVARVPKIPGQVITPGDGPIYDPPSDHDSLTLITDPSLPSHVTRQLVSGLQEFTLEHRDISCTFRIHLTENQPENGADTYKYRAAAFSGVRSFSGMATGGVKICSVFACTGDTIDTCGKRFSKYTPNTTAIFNELNIIASVTTPVVVPSVEARDTVYFPISVDTSIMPLEPKDYAYSEDINGNKTVYTLQLENSKAELYGFGVWGRVFADDGEDADPPLDDTTEKPNVSTPEEIEPTTADPDSASVHLLAKIMLLPALILLFRPQ